MPGSSDSDSATDSDAESNDEFVPRGKMTDASKGEKTKGAQIGPKSKASEESKGKVGQSAPAKDSTSKAAATAKPKK